MAVLSGKSKQELRADKFFGVNESPDGDTGLKFGEAAAMRNWRITSEGNLQTRPGQKTRVTVSAGRPIRAFWNGYVNGTNYTLVVCNGNVYTLNTSTWAVTSIGTLTDAATSILPYDNIVYFLNGHEYKYWDGTTFGDVVGYRPLIIIAAAPATGTNTLLQRKNKLNGLRRIQYTGTESTTNYQLPEYPVVSVDKVLVDAEEMTVTTDYSVNLTTGVITFVTAPGVSDPNNVEVWYTVSANDRATIEAQTNFQIFNGSTESRVFFYGDGTNKYYFSDYDYDTGLGRADYFPELNEGEVSSKNTPITSMDVHGNVLVAMKSDGNTTALSYAGSITYEDGTTGPGFDAYPINRDVGNEAKGQVRLVNNNLLSLYKGAVYMWKSSYISATRNERNTERISDRIRTTLSAFDFANSITYDDQENYEYWICYNGTCVLYNYQTDTWYTYTGINASAFLRLDGQLYIGTTGGTIEHFSRGYRHDNGTAIDCYWESGNESFKAETWEKSLSAVHIGWKPEIGSRVDVNIIPNTDMTTEPKTITMSFGFFSYALVDYSAFTYSTNQRPKISRQSFNVNRFIYAKITMSLNEVSATATITSLAMLYSYVRRI